MLTTPKRSTALACLLLLASPPGSAATPDRIAAEEIEGFYFLPNAGDVPARMLELRRNTFRIHTASGPEISGDLSSWDNTLAFVFFNGERLVTVLATYAVIDGHLWVGILQPLGVADRTWDGHTPAPGFFGGSVDPGPLERRGDVLRGAFSIDLGPIGLIARAIDLDSIVGEFRSSSGEHVRFVRDGVGTHEWSLPWLAHQFAGEAFHPNEHGLSTRAITPHPGVYNHADFPFVVFWISMGPDTMVRWVSAGGCLAPSPARGPEIFRRGE